MVSNKLDNIFALNGVKLGHRTLLIIVGKGGVDQVVNLQSKIDAKIRSSVLWCYSNEPKMGSSSSLTKVQYCRYAETCQLQGSTYGMCVLQDFEALTPNVLATTIETVRGGGIIIILVHHLVRSLRELYEFDMDLHANFKRKAEPHFNERLVLSFASHKHCVIVDDNLTLLLPTHLNLNNALTENIDKNETEFSNLKKQFEDNETIANLLGICKTLDQCKVLLKIVEAVTEKTLKTTVSLTGPRGRGKTAVLALGVCAAVAFGYSNIFVVASNPTSLNTFFNFILKGFASLKYEERQDYNLIQSTNPEFNGAIVSVNVFKNHRQTIQYIHPSDGNMRGQTDLLVVDEAAAMPLLYIKSLLGPHLMFLASTDSGFESSGSSVLLKLSRELRTQALPLGANVNAFNQKESAAVNGRALHEMTVNEPIRYNADDGVEHWLTDLLCLNSPSMPLGESGLPHPESCDLYYINRDTLFSYHRASEEFLHQLVALYSASAYKNTPDDLQIMSDAPNHHLFCLMGPVETNRRSLPEVLVFVEVCIEGEIPPVSRFSSKIEPPTHDLIPWLLCREYQYSNFLRLSGARILRIATHPNYQGMGYGTKAVRTLIEYYECKIANLDEDKMETECSVTSDEELVPRKGLPPLLAKLSERPPEKVDYVSVNFELTERLLKFWKTNDFVPLCLSCHNTDLEKVHICTALFPLNVNDQQDWLANYWTEFKEIFFNKLSRECCGFPSSLVFSVLSSKAIKTGTKNLTKQMMDVYFSEKDLKRLEMYSNNLIDFHIVKDLVTSMAKLYLYEEMGDVQLSIEQSAILLGIGLQHKSIESLAAELDLPSTQIMGLFNRIIRRFILYFNNIVEKELEEKQNPHSKMQVM